MNIYEFINLFNDDKVSIFEKNDVVPYIQRYPEMPNKPEKEKHGGLKKAGKIAGGTAAAAGAIYGGVKLAQRLKKRKACKAQFPNNPEKYKACMMK